jgi:hypothetical protein
VTERSSRRWRAVEVAWALREHRRLDLLLDEKLGADRRPPPVNERTCRSCGVLYVGHLAVCDSCHDRTRRLLAAVDAVVEGER